MSVKIIVDSTADLSSKIEGLVSVVPLTVVFGQEEFVDGVTITRKQFYEKLIETDIVPTTSQATPASFEKAYNEINDGDEAVVITISSNLSGTYQSACIAALDRSNIYVVDSGSVAIGTGILVERALQLCEQGLSAKQISEILEAEKQNIHIVALLDTLEYLKRGGRISKTVAFAGGVLNIKPVVAVRNGEILMRGKARGSKQGNNLLVMEIEKAGGVDFSRPILLGYTGLSNEMLNKYIEDSADLWQASTTNLNTTQIGSVIGTHAGPGAVAVAFFDNH